MPENKLTISYCRYGPGPLRVILYHHAVQTYGTSIDTRVIGMTPSVSFVLSMGVLPCVIHKAV